MSLWPPSHFLEIGIYRCTHDEFYKQYDHDREKYVNEVKAQWNRCNADVPPDILRQRDHEFGKAYGAWRYNQAVAWLRLYVYGTQVRGELWTSRAKQLRRITRKKQFSLWPATALEVECFWNQSSDEIRSAVRDELIVFQRKYRKGKCILDLECFDALSTFVDWRAVVGINSERIKTATPLEKLLTVAKAIGCP